MVVFFFCCLELLHSSRLLVMKRKREGEGPQGRDRFTFQDVKPDPGGVVAGGGGRVEDKGDYMAGSIVRIRMRSFLTYDDCEVEPGPRLNVVVGPNGTGKSTIVCAIAIGLGANCKVLGRGINEKDYIKHGANFGELEIELKGTNTPMTREGNVIVYHKISKTQQPEWRMGTFKTGRQLRMDITNRAGVKTRVAKLNVQIDNLCQFLPQDRVSAFASLNEKDLLWETLKAVGKDERLFNELANLIRMQKNIEEKKRRIELDQMTLDSDKAQNERLEAEITRYHERLRHLQIVKLCDAKKPVIELEELKRQYVEMEQKKVILDQDIAKFKDEAKPLEAQILQAKQQVRVEQAADMDLRKKMSSYQGNREKYYALFEKLDKDMETIFGKIAGLQDRQEDRKKEVLKIKNIIGEKQRALETLPSRQEMEQSIRELSQELQNLQNQGAVEIESLEVKKQEVFAEIREAKRDETEDNNQFQRQKNIKQMREKMIQQQNKDAYRAYMWVRNNRKLFKEDLLGPLSLELEVNCEEHALYVEKALGKSLAAFVAQNDHDESVFQRELIEKQALRVHLIRAPPSFSAPPRKASLEYMKKYGIECWFDSIWTASDIIRKTIFANNMFMFNSVVGNDYTLQSIDRFAEDPSLTKITGIYAAETVYVRSRSEYTGQESIRMDELRGNRPKYLVKGDQKAIERLEAKLHQHRSRIEALEKEAENYTKQQNQIERNVHEKKKQKLEEEKILMRRRALEQHIQTNLRELEDLEHEEDPQAQIAKLQKNLGQILLQQKNYIVEINKHNKHLLDLHREKTRKKLRESVEKAKADGLSKMLEKMHRKNLELFQEFKEISATLQEMAEILRRQQGVVQKHLLGIPEEERQQFQELPNDLEELQVLRQSSQTKAQVNTSTNAQVITEFEEREKTIQVLEQQTTENMNEINEQQREIKTLKQRWSQETKGIIGRLSDNFQTYMKKIGCDGVVKLHSPEERFSEYGIQIMVKFRKKSKLQQLKGMMQSGGEKSVATMLYLVSLQPLTPCPFRLVDEINQGMDARNERMIFEQVVSSASGGDVGGNEVPQYFLITPKLLPDLKFERHMRVLCILNGPWQDHLPAWSVQSVAAAMGPFGGVRASEQPLPATRRY